MKSHHANQAIKYVIALMLGVLLTVCAFGQQPLTGLIAGYDGKESKPLLVSSDSRGKTYIASDDLKVIHDNTCEQMVFKKCSPHWLINPRFEAKIFTELNRPNKDGATLIVALVAVYDKPFSLTFGSITGYDVNEKKLYRVDNRAALGRYGVGMMTPATEDLDSPGYELDRNLVIRLCGLLEANETLEDKQFQYALDRIPRIP